MLSDNGLFSQSSDVAMSILKYLQSTAGGGFRDSDIYQLVDCEVSTISCLMHRNWPLWWRNGEAECQHIGTSARKSRCEFWFDEVER